jgi:PBP1b-binding outer membrane lipoprotein LpoB
MKTKIIVLLLIFGIVLLSGCAGDEQPSPEENATPEETSTPVENLTDVETTPEENVTVVETETPEENITVAETETPEENENEGTVKGTVGVSTPGIKQTPYTVRLDNNMASPSSLEIKKGEAVAWLNTEDNPRRTFTLVSEENLFENTNLVYKRSFAYTFNETGVYNFSVVGQPRMNVTVSVV